MNYTIKLFPIKLMTFISCCILFFSCAKTTEQKNEISTLPYYDEATFTPHWFRADDTALIDFHKISPFQLTNQDGETITGETFAGKIYVTDFFFTICPGICPKMTKNMGVLQEEFLEDDEVLLLSHSVTPDMDSVSVLKKYAEEKGVISKKWHLVTGSQQDIYKLGRKDYFVEEDLGLEKKEDEFLHTENFVLIDQNKYIRGIYNGLNSASVSQLIKDIKTLQMEK